MLADYGVEQSTNRPGVSNDNSQQECVFKLLKHGPKLPRRLADTAEAASFIDKWVTWYNTRWIHSALGGYTPQSVFDGTWVQTLKLRDQAKAAYAMAHPERFVNGITPIPTPPAMVTINMENDGTTIKPSILAELICAKAA